ncbi:MAG TPA: hypothetical protein P5567_01095 [Kiritimatiellia bacterium]|nr:hypothetical protein [Kiritimatiellia bacterium]HRZ11030.1 hypothetical protein [Kiritimatiellia bacterium]HSA18603.1 hypothetical protein [Kiritimatiellia bacterium]
MKTFLMIALVSLGCLSVLAEDIPVANANALVAALARAESGDRVLVSRGNYVGNFTVPPGVSLLGEPEFMPAGGLMPLFSPWGDTPTVVEQTRIGEKHPTQVRGIFFTGAKMSALEVRGDGIGYVCHNMFEQNRGPRGGAIYSGAAGTIYIQTNYFSANTAETDGGAVFIGGTASVSLRMNEFLRNGAGTSGGGFAVRGTNAVASDRDFFMDNTAGVDGGSVSVVLNPKPVILNRASLFGSEAGRDGGDVSVDRSLMMVLSGSSSGAMAGRHGGSLAAIDGVIGVSGFNCNSARAAELGGGVYSEASLISCQGSEWTSCAARFGGGMAIRGMPAAGGNPPSIQRNTFRQNRANKDGGALYLADLKEARIENNVLFMNTAGVGDGMAIDPDATALVDHNTVAHIEYRSGQPRPTAEAIRVRGAGNTTRVVNNIIAGHACGVIGDAGGRVQVLGNDFWLTMLPWRDVPNPAGLLNRQVDPLFVRFDPRRLIGDLHLQVNSPCRNAGVVPILTTLDRDARRRDAQPDRGAYELPAP